MARSRTGHLRGVRLRTNPAGPAPAAARFRIAYATWHARLGGSKDGATMAPVAIGSGRIVGLDAGRQAA